MEDTNITQLVRLAQVGDREAFGQLAAHFEPTVFAIVMCRLRNSSEAREVTQDILLRAMRKLDQLREPQAFAGWLKQIAVRMAINHAVRRPKEAVCTPDMFGSIGDQSRTLPLDHLMESERATRVRGGLDRLKPLDRDTLMAFYFEGQSLKEMSDRTGSPIGTIKRRLHTARNRLRDELADLQPA